MAIYQDIMSSEYVEIARQFHVNSEHCDNPEHYERYINQDCFTDQNQGMGVTHVFIDENEKTGQKIIAGYITLRMSSLIMDSGEGFKLGYPALEIAELAVDENYEGQRIGTDMVMTAINEAVEMNRGKIGVQYVILCADTAAVEFYSRKELGFRKIRYMQEIPREHRNSTCEPMMLKIVKNM